jgi:hypothetical protein
MPISLHCRRLATAVFTGCAVAAVTLATPIGFGALSAAHAQVSDDFQDALAPYGEWRDHPRWGHVWVPLDRPDGWRPYTYGHWVYTDDWGWYWVSDNDEADWGWVTYHYGRWVFDRGMGWLWVPGEEWAPAWVDWRRGSDAVGWAPLPPEDMAADTEYDQDPNYWIFVQPRYMMAPRLRGYVLPPQRATVVFRDTVLVNRTVRLNRERERIAVNPGIAPNIVAAVTRGAVPTYRVQPRVFAGTQGVQGAVQVRREDFVRRGPPGQPGQRPGPSRVQVSVQRTTTVIQPAATVPKPEALGRDDRGGRLGSRPPRAAQGAAVAPAQQQQPAQQQERQQRPAQQPQPQAQPQQQRPAAAPPQTTPPPAGREARPSVSAPPAAQTRPEPPRPGAPQEREEQRQQGRQDNRQDNRQENRQENREERREQRPAVSAPPASAPQARPAAPTAAAHPPAPPPPAAPAVQRPAAPPPQAARPPAPPPQAHAPAPPQPHPPAPPQARPPAPPPAAARPAPQPQRPAAQAQHPPPKPGEKPQDDRK